MKGHSTFISKFENKQATGSIIFLHLSHSKLSSAYNLLCRITLFVSCVNSLTARYKHWNYLGLVCSLSCLYSRENETDSTVFISSARSEKNVYRLF